MAPSSSGGILTLRPAHVEDAYPLWIWANNEETRDASGSTGTIAWRAHAGWLLAGVTSPEHRIWMGRDGEGLIVGSVRFDSVDGWKSARLSYVVAPESRGKGYGTQLVAIGTYYLRHEFPGINLLADVRDDNAASRRIFQKLLWREGGDDNVHRFTFP